eukprot:symbB.v1.2.028350.t1/scaffold2996.1/size65695/5
MFGINLNQLNAFAWGFSCFDTLDASVRSGDLLLVQAESEYFAKVVSVSPLKLQPLLPQAHDLGRQVAVLRGTAYATPGERAIIALRGLCLATGPWRLTGRLADLLRSTSELESLEPEHLKHLQGACNLKQGQHWHTESQRQIIATAQRKELLLIHGPPGTGKTSTAAAIISQWIQEEGRVLCTAESHVAAKRLVDALYFAPVMHLQWTGDVPWLELQKQLRAARVVVATCTGSGHELLSSVAFRWLLIDEATQATEPAALIPICRSSGAQQLVLLGDPQQLPPTVLSAQAIRWGLSTTLFDRLRRQKHVPMLLDVQFRMHPMLCSFPAAAFYGGQVQTSVDITSQLLAFEFRGVHGREKQIGSSFCNSSEADVVMSILSQLTTDLQSILLVAPYRAQRALLERRLADLRYKDHRLQALQPLQDATSIILAILRGFGLSMVELRRQNGDQVSTIDALQGGECDLLIFSATRSNTAGVVGFLSDKRRVNVVLTRARRGLIVVGDPRTLAHDATWAAWLKFVKTQSALSLEPLDPYTLAVRAEAHLCLGNRDDAIGDCDQALDLNRNLDYAVMIRERACSNDRLQDLLSPHS